MPRTGDAALGDGALVQRATAMRAPVSQGDDPVRQPAQQHRHPTGIDTHRGVGGHVGLGRNVGPVLRQVLERGGVDPHAQPVHEVLTQPDPAAEESRRGQ